MATLHYPNRVLGNVVESDSAQKQAATAPAHRKLRLPTHHSTSSRNCQEFRHMTLRAAPLDCATEQSRDGFSEGKANARKWSNCPRESFATEPLRTSTRAHNCTNGGAGPAENAPNKNPPRRRIRKTSSLLLVRTATRSAPRRQKRARPSSEQHKKHETREQEIATRLRKKIPPRKAQNSNNSEPIELRRSEAKDTACLPACNRASEKEFLNLFSA